MIFKREEEATAEGISGRPPPTQKMPKYQGGSKRGAKTPGLVKNLILFPSLFPIMDNWKCVYTNTQQCLYFRHTMNADITVNGVSVLGPPRLARNT